MNEISLGEKIKSRRLSLGLTQSALADGEITRNMISLIECGKTMPSYQVSVMLAKKLDIPVGYLYSGMDDLPFYEKEKALPYLKELYSKGSYLHCLNSAMKLSEPDDEINYFITRCAFYHGKACVLRGSLKTATKYFRLSLERSKATVYNTSDIEALVFLYSSLTENIHTPLLGFNIKDFEEKFLISDEYEFLKYLTNDLDYTYKSELLSKHIEAKRLMKLGKYEEALKILIYIAENKTALGYNAYVIFGVYGDIETSYKKTGDFENAYRFSGKRISLLNNFNS